MSGRNGGLLEKNVSSIALMLSNHVVDQLETRNNVLQCTIASLSVRPAGIEARHRPSRGCGVIDDRDDNHSPCILAIREGLHFGDDQPFDLHLRLRLFFHVNNLSNRFLQCSPGNGASGICQVFIDRIRNKIANPAVLIGANLFDEFQLVWKKIHRRAHQVFAGGIWTPVACELKALRHFG